MRDIRGDLQERAKLLDEEIGAAQDQFDEIMEQLKLEHQRKAEDLKSDLDAVQMVIKTEDRLFGSPAELQSEESLPTQHHRWHQAQSKQSASPVMMRKVG
jgi:outer membrane PBP1 activator LpoA protein